MDHTHGRGDEDGDDDADDSSIESMETHPPGFNNNPTTQQSHQLIL